MADWGPFVQGLAHTLPQVGFQTYGLRQRDEALARQEKQLNEQIKRQEINVAQENFFKGVQLLPTLSDDMSPALVKTIIAPAISTLNKHGITGYSAEETNAFLEQLQQNPTAAKAVAKDINALIKNPSYQSKDGTMNYPSLIKDMKLVFNQHAAKLSESQKKGIESLIQDTAMEGISKTHDEAGKQYLGAQLSATQQKAYGIGSESTINAFNVFYRGYKQSNPNATEAEISAAWDKKQLDQAKQKIQVTVNAKGGDMSDESIRQEGIKYAMTGKMPSLGMGNAQMRSKIINAASAWIREQGIDPTDVPGLQAEVTGEGKSLANQQKIRGMMGGFVRNMDKQIDRVESIHKDIAKRVGIRALDMPIRELRKRFVGSGNEAILEAYMVEISNEIGKLSTGSAASIRELSVDAQERWAKVHDPNLSFNELLKVLKETKHMGKLRLQGADEEITATKGRMKKGPKKEAEADPLGIR